MNNRLQIVGWREWIGLPQLGIKKIKAKLDTGARSSSLHAFDIETFRRDDQDFVRFKVHPIQRSDRKVLSLESSVLEFREIRSSSGHTTVRPVIETELELLGLRHKIELTLADRNQMGFRMLVGREALKDRFMVDSGRSYYGGRPKKKTRRAGTGNQSTVKQSGTPRQGLGSNK
jgi:hypothetical protein